MNRVKIGIALTMLGGMTALVLWVFLVNVETQLRLFSHESRATPTPTPTQDPEWLAKQERLTSALQALSAEEQAEYDRAYEAMMFVKEEVEGLMALDERGVLQPAYACRNVDELEEELLLALEWVEEHQEPEFELFEEQTLAVASETLFVLAFCWERDGG